MVLWFIMLQAQGQVINLKGQFTNTAGFDKVSLVGFKDSLNVLAQSALKKDAFALQLKDLVPGIYRLQYGPNPLEHAIDLLITARDTAISLQMDLRIEHKEPQIIGSKINQQLYAYLKKQKEGLAQLQFHYQTYHAAPNKNQKAAVLSKKDFEKNYKALLKDEQQFLKQHAGDLAGLYVSAKPLWLPTLALDPNLYYSQKYKEYWFKLPKPTTTLQNTPFYHTYLMEYMSYYFFQRLEPEPWEMQIKKAVDTAMLYMNQNDYTRKLALQYFLENFKAIGHEGLMQYVDEKYAQNAQCLEAGLQEDVAYRLKSYEVGKEGQQVPNFSINTTKDFYSVLKGKAILLFWSINCPHCMQEWPEIEKWKKEHPEYQVIAISLDTDKVSYEEAIKKLPQDITFLSDFKGYDSEYIKPFYIMATPTFFEIDVDRKFVKKGKGMKQFD